MELEASMNSFQVAAPLDHTSMMIEGLVQVERDITLAMHGGWYGGYEESSILG